MESGCAKFIGIWMARDRVGLGRVASIPVRNKGGGRVAGSWRFGWELTRPLLCTAVWLGVGLEESAGLVVLAPSVRDSAPFGFRCQGKVLDFGERFLYNLAS